MGRDDVVKDYGRAWEETDDAARRRLLERVWSDDGLYCDRMARAQGRQALDDLINSVSSASAALFLRSSLDRLPGDCSGRTRRARR